MSDIAIRVENLSKKYRIGESIRQDTLRDALAHALPRIARIARKNGDSTTSEQDSSSSNSSNSFNSWQESSSEFWALKDVSFEVKRGEVVGVIGRNGAGKSTLLKVLSRITEPTSGVAEIHGRVGSLLEVGTGFHPELTGRENIYLNGAILGMKRVEIERKFDEIVAFAEIEKFLDTPVKRYSSGMYVRLAFAVAAHLEPEILLVDEVLAVGDAAFQKKCLGKMGDVAKEGRTVLFVSHNMAAIGQLCERCLLFDAGHIDFGGPSQLTISRYLESSYETTGGMWGLSNLQKENIRVRIVSVVCEPLPVFIGSPFSITIEYLVESTQTGLMFGVSIENSLGQRIIGSYTGREGLATGTVRGKQYAKVSFPALTLIPGVYSVTIAVHERSGENIIRIDRVASFEVIARDLTESGNLIDNRNGLVWVEHEWELTGPSSNQ